MTEPKREPAALSPWWRHATILVMIAGFSVLSLVTVLTYTNAPPIPGARHGRGGSDAVRPSRRSSTGRRSSSSTASWSTGRSGVTAPTLGPTTARSTSTASPRSAARERTPTGEGVASELKQNRYDAATDTLVFSPCEASSLEIQGREWEQYFRGPTPAPGLGVLVHQGPRRGQGPDRLLRLGHLGHRRQPARARTTRTPTTGPTSPGRQPPEQLHLPLERHEPDHAPRRHRRDPLLLRQVRLPRLGRREDARALPRQRPRRMEADAEPVGHGEVLRRGRRAVPAAEPRGRRARPLPRRAGGVLRPRHRVAPALQPAPHLAPAARDLLDRDGLGGRRPLPRSARGPRRAQGTAPRRERAVRRARLRGARQPARGVAGDQRPARRSLVLARPPGLGVPGPGPVLAVAARRRPRAVARPHVPRPATRDEDRRAARSWPRSSSTRPRPSRSSTCPLSSTAPTPTSRSSTTGASGSSTSGSRASSSCSPRSSSRRCSTRWGS